MANTITKAVAPSNATRTATRSVAELKAQQAELERQIAEVALQEVGSYDEAIASLKSDFQPLAERYATIKAAYPQAVPPWSTFANRNNIADWLRGQGAIDEGNAISVAAIVEGTGLNPDDVARLLKNSSEGKRKLFVKVGKDSWYANS
jgi:hypothetical protein